MKNQTAQMKLRVLIADDHPIFRKGLVMAIEGDSAIEIVGEAGDGQQVLQLAEDSSATEREG